MKEYEVRYTKLAEAFLGQFKAAFEEKLRGELARELPEDYYPPEIMFHNVKYQDRDYIAVGKNDHILVDSSTYEETAPITTGRFKGRRILIPMPDSE
jgi:hypothetical protein